LANSQDFTTPPLQNTCEAEESWLKKKVLEKLLRILLHCSAANTVHFVSGPMLMIQSSDPFKSSSILIEAPTHERFV
jgi:hypothetical protein